MRHTEIDKFTFCMTFPQEGLQHVPHSEFVCTDTEKLKCNELAFLSFSPLLLLLTPAFLPAAHPTLVPLTSPLPTTFDLRGLAQFSHSLTALFGSCLDKQICITSFLLFHIITFSLSIPPSLSPFSHAPSHNEESLETPQC